MPPRDGNSRLVRIVVGERGRVDLHGELILRFDYGSTVPWVTRIDDAHAARHRRARHGGAALVGRICTAKISRPSAISPLPPAKPCRSC